jgi:hypothetical protein
MMRILFVAFSHSLHTARWIRLLEHTGWELFLFPTQLPKLHPALDDAGRTPPAMLPPWLGRKRWLRICSMAPNLFTERIAHRAMREISPDGSWRSRWLSREIARIRPDIVHSLEFQSAAYLCLATKESMGTRFPTWIATNWGSDLFLFGRLQEHRERVRRVLQSVDYYTAECQRDVDLARDMGLTAPAWPVFPNLGGFDLQAVQQLAQPGPTSARRVIAIKGYQHFAGRALTALQAIGLCAPRLGGYRIRLFSATPDVKIAAELLAQETGLEVTCVPDLSPNEDILRLHGSARISIGVSIADAISTSLLEAMVMGSFPIQTRTACADEWIEDGVSGFIVPPEDPALIAERILRAVSDDALVDSSAEINWRVAQERLNRGRIRAQVIENYRQVLEESRSG